MRLANIGGRAALVSEGRATDIAAASGGRFGPDPMSVFESWDEFVAWAGETDLPTGETFAESELDIPVPRPAQAFALLVNYPEAASLPGMRIPEEPVAVAKFPSSLIAPFAEIELPSDSVDYETTLVLAIGRGGWRIPEAEAWDHIAGIAIGQDLSDREAMRTAPAPQQFGLAKSAPGFGPFGPYLVTPEEFEDRDTIGFRATLTAPGIEGETILQEGNSNDMVFAPPAIVSRLSQRVRLLPGDLVFTGTPGGIGLERGRLLRPGDVVTSTLDGIGSIRNAFRSPS